MTVPTSISLHHKLSQNMLLEMYCRISVRSKVYFYLSEVLNQMSYSCPKYSLVYTAKIRTLFSQSIASGQ